MVGWLISCFLSKVDDLNAFLLSKSNSEARFDALPRG